MTALSLQGLDIRQRRHERGIELRQVHRRKIQPLQLRDAETGAVRALGAAPALADLQAADWCKDADPDLGRLELDRKRHNAPRLVGDGAIALRQPDVFRKRPCRVEIEVAPDRPLLRPDDARQVG